MPMGQWSTVTASVQGGKTELTVNGKSFTGSIPEEIVYQPPPQELAIGCAANRPYSGYLANIRIGPSKESCEEPKTE
jgi:hypothetical protein